MKRLLLLTVGLSLAIGCGGGDDSVALEDLGDEAEAASCEAEVACGLYADMQSCREASPLDMAQMLLSVDEGRIDYDADAAQDCLDVLSDASDCSWSSVFSAGESTACDNVFVGTVAVGGECYDSNECVGTAYCNANCSEACCAGTCVEGEPETDPVAVGGDCSEDACVTGAYCDGETELCVAGGNAGDACDGFGYGFCAAGLFCDGLFGASTCYALPAAGETCDPERGFGLVGCDKTTLWCDPSDNTCKDKLPVGGTCVAETAACVANAECVDGTCVAKPGLGDACGTDAAVEDCLGELNCTSGTCVAPTPDTACGAGS